MPRLAAFENISLDGYFTDANSEMDWAKSQDPEIQAFVRDNARGGGALVFGRLTYEMMAGYWPTAMAAKNNPVVAERMNAMHKIVFSRTLDRAQWSNATLAKGDLVTEIRRLKEAPGEDLTILGSGSIVAQLAEAGLIDEYQIVLNPIALGAGRTPFEGVSRRVGLRLTKSRTFGNGSVFLCYEPA
jgi:dihydrofolate reductase